MTKRDLLVGFACLTVACQPPKTAGIEPRCYALTWTDTTWSSIVPDSVALLSGPDSSSSHPNKEPFPLVAIRASDSTNSRWRGLTGSDWFNRKNALVLRFRSQNAQWATYFTPGDTLRGTVVFSGFGRDGALPPRAATTGSPASGVRIPCAEQAALAAATAAARLPAAPEAVADQFVHALGARHWETMVGLMHPAALHELRTMLAPLTESPSLDQERLQLLGVRSLTQAQALSDSAFSVAFLSRVLSAKPEALDLVRDSKIEIIGHVSEGRDTVHVVYRMTYQKGEAAVSKTDVFSLRRMGSTWRGLLSMDFRMLGAMLRRESRS